MAVEVFVVLVPGSHLAGSTRHVLHQSPVEELASVLGVEFAGLNSG